MKGLSKNLCPPGGDILAYLYNEMAPVDRERFELHLADCTDCIDEFADLSQGRHPVYEWKQLEFDQLLTPKIAIPYSSASVSWFDELSAAFAFDRRFAFGAAAALLLAVVAGYLTFSTPAEDIAQNVEPSPSPERIAVEQVLPPQPAAERWDVQPVIDDKTEPVKVSRRSRPAAGARSTKPASRATPKKIESIPVYSTIDEEDEEDDSLRLTDLFAELGTSE